MLFCFFFNDTATTEIYTLSLHDALPISNENWGNEFLFGALHLEGIVLHEGWIFTQYSIHAHAIYHSVNFVLDASRGLNQLHVDERHGNPEGK